MSRDYGSGYFIDSMSQTCFRVLRSNHCVTLNHSAEEDNCGGTVAEKNIDLLSHKNGGG